jgi:WD40 repeat protein
VRHTDTGPTLQKVFSFSQDGKYFAIVDRTTIETASGGTEGSGAVISIWTTSDFKKVLSIPVRFPFEVASIAISPDNALIAAAQRDFIDIFDMADGKPIATIDSLCFSYQREIIFGPYNVPPMLLENSNCSSLTWVIVEDTARPASNNAPDFSKIVFNKTGGYQAISYPQPMSDFSVYEWFHYMFLNNDLLAAQNRHSVDTYACNLDLSAGNYDCQRDTTESVNNQILGKDRILATDGKYYDYEVSSRKVEIFSAENKTQVFYSIPFQNYGFSLLALDPINNTVMYEEALTPSVIRSVIQDMERNRVLAEYKGETFISSLVFSQNKNYAAFCRSIGYNSRLNKDKLIVFDLVGKKIIYNQTSSCGYAALALSKDGSKLAIQFPYLKNPTDRRYSGKLQIFNTQPPYDRQDADVDAPQYAIAFSPDDSLLAVTCGQRDVCFFDVANTSMIYQLEAHSQINSLAFSPDGSILSMYSNWGMNSFWAIPPFEIRTK